MRIFTRETGFVCQLLLVALGGSLAGCAGSLQGDIDTLRATQQAEARRLDAIRQEIAASEQKADEARTRAEFEECRALRSSIVADATVSSAVCLQQRAEHSECGAKNSERTASAGVLGCLAGIGVAAVTAGVGTGVALLGCGSGLVAGKAASDDCPQVACESDPAVTVPAAVRAHGLQQLPMCGGVLGVLVTSDTATIVQLTPQSAGGVAGLRPGDRIVAVNRVATPNVAALTRELEKHPPGEVVGVAAQRGGDAFEVPVKLQRPVAQ